MLGFGGHALLSLLLLKALVLLSWNGAPTRAAEVVYDWVLKAVLQNNLSPDCMDIKNARRGMFLVVDDNAGPQFPGPLVEANEGDTIRVSIQVSSLNDGVISIMLLCCTDLADSGDEHAPHRRRGDSLARHPPKGHTVHGRPHRYYAVRAGIETVPRIRLCRLSTGHALLARPRIVASRGWPERTHCGTSQRPRTVQI
jgi:hypothetical protein